MNLKIRVAQLHYKMCIFERLSVFFCLLKGKSNLIKGVIYTIIEQLKLKSKTLEKLYLKNSVSIKRLDKI